MSTERLETARLKVFISYSRADAAFADELVAGLEYGDRFTVTIDRHSIVEGEDWRRRIGALIADADTVVFVLSPDSVQSDICVWEVEEAHRLSKRILPVLAHSVGSLPVPPLLAALNYVRFDEGRSFMAGLKALATALQTDVDWLREHTRLLARAMEWEGAGRQPNRMLAGNDIAEAKAWIARRPRDAPEPTELHLEFIRASEQAELGRTNAERQRLEEMAAAQAARAEALAERETVVKKLSRRTTAGLVGAGSLTAMAAALAYWGTDAESRFRREKERAEDAQKRSLDAAIKREAMRTDLEGQLSAYAASPGQEADDGPEGGNSPYTKHVLEELASADAPLQAALAKAHYRVLGTSRTSQRPYLATDLNGEIYLRQPPTSRRLKALVVSVAHMGDGVPLLANVERDANAWRGYLERCGFQVEALVNPRRSAIKDAMDSIKFEKRDTDYRRNNLIQKVSILPSPGAPPPNTMIAFFFSGAGGYRAGGNYIMTGDTKVAPLEDAHQSMLAVSDIQAWARRTAAASLIVLDTNFFNTDPKPPGTATR